MIFRAVVFTFLPTAVELVAVCAILARAFHPRVSLLVLATFATYAAWTVALTWVRLAGWLAGWVGLPACLPACLATSAAQPSAQPAPMQPLAASTDILPHPLAPLTPPRRPPPACGGR